MMRSRYAVLVMGCLIASAGRSWAPTGISAIPTGSNNLLYETFRQWCSEAPDFDALSKRGGSYKPMGDNKGSRPDGSMVETRQWEYRKASGDFMIGAVQVTRAGKTTSACNVYFPGLADGSMPNFLSEAGRLGPPLRQSPAKDVTLWTGPFPNTTVQLELRNAGQRFEGVLTLTQTEPGQ